MRSSSLFAVGLLSRLTRRILFRMMHGVGRDDPGEPIPIISAGIHISVEARNAKAIARNKMLTRFL